MCPPEMTPISSAASFILTQRFWIVVWCGLVCAPAGWAQLSPFPDVDSPGSGARDLPEILTSDVNDPAVNARQPTADRIARLFNRELRDLEEAQEDILIQLDTLPRISRETQRINAFGYHSGSAKQRPKWLQIDLGRELTPSAIALFPVTAEVDGETLAGYGFPRNFRVDISNEDDFRNYETMMEGRVEDVSSVLRWPYFRELGGYSGRYVRVTATGLWRLPDSKQEVFALSEIMVLEGDRNVAVGCEVTSLDSVDVGDQWSRRFVCDGITTLGIPHGGEESPTMGFRSRSEAPVATSWVQVDLGEPLPIDEIQLIMADSPGLVPDPTVRFPHPLRVEISDAPDMRQAELVGRYSPHQISLIGSNPLVIPVKKGLGRYVRVSVSGVKDPEPLSFDLAELIVFSGVENVSAGRSVTASHPLKQNGWSPEYLVDGYSSRRNLVPCLSWLADMDKRNRLSRRWTEHESRRLDLVDSTVSRGVAYMASGLAGILGLVLVGLSRGRIRRRQDLEALRQRIASDLHDDIGSNLSSIALLAELGKTETDQPDLVIEELTEIKATADKTIESMRDIVWLIRPGEETWAQLVTRFRETASKLLRAHDYQFTIHGETHDDRLPLEFKRDLFLIYKEVLNNIVRHAHAARVGIEIDCQKNRLQMRITDDGIGFDNLDQGFREGNGLRNLRMRATAIGANLKVRSTLHEGTSVHLTMAMP